MGSQDYTRGCNIDCTDCKYLLEGYSKVSIWRGNQSCSEANGKNCDESEKKCVKFGVKTVYLVTWSVHRETGRTKLNHMWCFCGVRMLKDQVTAIYNSLSELIGIYDTPSILDYRLWDEIVCICAMYSTCVYIIYMYIKYKKLVYHLFPDDISPQLFNSVQIFCFEDPSSTSHFLWQMNGQGVYHMWCICWVTILKAQATAIYNSLTIMSELVGMQFSCTKHTLLTMCNTGTAIFHCMSIVSAVIVHCTNFPNSHWSASLLEKFPLSGIRLQEARS